MNTNELWQAVLGELELGLSKANFTTWFKSTFIASFSKNEIIIGVPNLFTKAWLEKKYHKQILQSLQNITNEEVRLINYVVETRPGQAQQINPEPTTTPAATALIVEIQTATPASTNLQNLESSTFSAPSW